MGSALHATLIDVPRATATSIAELERHEVVGGEVVQKAAPSGEHSIAQGGVIAALAPFRRRRGGGRGDDEGGGWWIGPEVEIELEDHEVYVPDIAGWRVSRSPEPPRGKPVRIIPDWVCEVLSPSTAGRDIGSKQRAYYRARVGHYWIIDPLHQTLLVLRWQETGYLIALAASASEMVRAEPFEAVELDLASVFSSF